jgi:hypothetical protein
LKVASKFEAVTTSALSHSSAETPDRVEKYFDAFAAIMRDD